MTQILGASACSSGFTPQFSDCQAQPFLAAHFLNHRRAVA
jgi:hypothetical protein